MKTIATLIFVLFIGLAAQAQDAPKEVKVDTVEMSYDTTAASKEAALEMKTEVARLYMFKDAKIKKALSFRTKRDRSKLA